MNTSNNSPLNSLTDFFKQRAVFFKILGIGFLVLLLLIPLNMIQGVLRERLGRRNQAVAEVTSSWGREQTLVGPVLIVPYRYSFKSWKDVEAADGTLTRTEVQNTAVANAYFLPETLEIDGDITPTRLRRGIYKAVVYSGTLEVTGGFARPDFSGLRVDEEDVLWEEALVTVAIPDLRGVKETLLLRWGEETIPLVPGCKLPSFAAGVHARVDGLRQSEGAIPLGLTLTLNGSGGIRFTPVAGETRIHLRSPWPNPSFQGAFLPTDRQVTASGFEATWQLSQYGRDYPQQWTDRRDRGAGLDSGSVVSSLFGVNFLSDIDAYRNVERAIKYGILFIVLVFTAFFLFEVLGRLRIHPMQYTLVGVALCLFYLGLLSLSEFVRFGMAYFGAATLTTCLIWFYCAAVLKSGKRTLLVVGMLAGIYGFLYVPLQLQDYSLLVGTSGLFLVLAIVFGVTRRIDWYGRDERGGQNAE